MKFIIRLNFYELKCQVQNPGWDASVLVRNLGRIILFSINSNILSLKLLQMYMTVQCWEKDKRLCTNRSIWFYEVFEI